jgi:hypothetical protein
MELPGKGRKVTGPIAQDLLSLFKIDALLPP